MSDVTELDLNSFVRFQAFQNARDCDNRQRKTEVTATRRVLQKKKKLQNNRERPKHYLQHIRKNPVPVQLL